MIEITHPKYDENITRWRKIEDVTRMRNLGNYLVTLNPQDTSPENATRNAQYKERAIFYAVTSQTVQGMLGSMFRKWPELSVPDALEYLKDNADGSGNSIYQCSQSSADDVIRKGRAGIRVAYPRTEGEVSRADIQSGRMVATIQRYQPEDVLNWRVEWDGAQLRLILVVVSEVVDTGDYYAQVEEQIYRELYLDYQRDEQGNAISDRREIYRERVWKQNVGKEWESIEEFTPTDAQGSTWEFIPFSFIGSENNDTDPDFPPMLPIVELNIGHYRNSADYEDSVWFCGQPQPWMSGITQDHINLMQENKQYVGSRNLVGVPSGEQFGFAQAEPNPMVKEAMQTKIDAMVAMGARLMQVGSATKTAEQAAGDREASTSVLAMVAGNVSEAYTRALAWVARYMGASDADLKYEISQEFVKLDANPQEIQQIVAAFLQGAMPAVDYVRWMRKKELFRDDVTDDDYITLLGGASEGL